MSEKVTNWADAPFLTERLQSPQDRLNAVLNIVQNGAQTLTVLSMIPDIHHFESPYKINRRTGDILGTPIVHGKTTAQSLSQTIEPVGLAAKSTINEDEWAISEFGITSRAALIFAWQGFMDMAIDPMTVLATLSAGEKDEQGNLITTPPEVRFKILRALPKDATRSIKAIADEIKVAGPAVSRHVENLGQNGFLKVNIYERFSQEFVNSYTITEKGKTEEEWPVYTVGRQRNIVLSGEIKDAVKYLFDQGLPITIPAIKKFIATKRGKPEQSKGGGRSINVAGALLNWANDDIGLLTKTGPSENEMSDVTITPLGYFVYRHILSPLYNWSRDNQSVAEINLIDQQLRRDALAYQELRQEIARVFINNSPAKNRDPDGKMDLAIRLVRQHPGEYSKADLARLIGTSPSNMEKIVGRLLKTGDIFTEPSERGLKLLLYPTQSS